MDPLTIISIVGYVSLVISGILYLFSRVPKQTIANYKDLAVSQEKRITDLEEQNKIAANQHLENVRMLGALQGQIDVYKELPLQQMAESMKEIASTNKKILEIIKV